MADFSKCPDVRLAVPEDIPVLLDLVRSYCEEEGKHPMDEDKVLHHVYRYFEKMGVLIAVIGDVGSPVAYILMEVCPLWYSQDFELLEKSHFVHPEYRKSDRAKQLMDFSKQASNGLNLELKIGVLSNDKTAAKVRLYQRQFENAGSFFMYRPSSAESNV